MACFITVAVAATLLLCSGVEAGHGGDHGGYRRIIITRGSAMPKPMTYYGREATCFDIPLYDFAVGELIGDVLGCMSDKKPDPDCPMGFNATLTINYTIGDDSFVYRS